MKKHSPVSLDKVNLDAFPGFTKLEIAVIQLDRAIRLRLDDEDIISATTLAGAAEEILGTLVRNSGNINWLDSLKANCMAGIREIGEDWDEASVGKIISENENWHRNQFKHLDNCDYIQIIPEIADNMIHRGSENYFKLTGTYTDQMLRFRKEIFGI